MRRNLKLTKSTVLGAGGGAAGRAERRVPSVASVAVGVAASGGRVEPAPVGVEGNGLGGSGATTRLGALGDLELGVALSGVGADLLGRDNREGRESEESSTREHFWV
jgi:hypothetical protein